MKKYGKTRFISVMFSKFAVNMTYNLTIDQGNTSAKYALWDGDGQMVGIQSRLRVEARDVAQMLPKYDVDTAIYCTVSRRSSTLMHALQRCCRHVIEFSVNTPMPLTVDYRTPDTLGLDRLAAAVGAYALDGCAGRELLVVDLGTAITYDRVTADARYIGGNIAPGVFMRLKALNHYTARLPLVDPRQADSIEMWGDDTRHALLSGAVRGVVAELEYYHAKAGENAAVVLTGGDAEFIAPMLHFDVHIRPNLVSEGLEHIIRYNNAADSAAR